MRVFFFLLGALAGVSPAVELWAVISGRMAQGRLGSAITALDFNGDGYYDLIVGEPGWNRVWVFFGGPGFDTVPDLVLTGVAGSDFGTSVVALGDINGDGFDDLAIGAPRDNSGGASAGRVFVFFGDTLPPSTPAITLTGRNPGGRFGYALAGGDVNGDGTPDLLVGAPGAQRAYLYLGGEPFDTIPALTLRAGNGDYFGGAVALTGDVNRDSFGDILVGDYRHTGGVLHGGGCFLYYGGAPPDSVLDRLWEGGEGNYNLGVRVCGPGDLNGDGALDVAFASSFNALVEVRFGAEEINQLPDLVLHGARRFGSALAGGADCNGDGFFDLLVGADGDDYGVPTGPGYAYLFSGGNPMDTTPAAVLAGEGEGDMFGAAVAFIGDINGDGRVDFAVGAPGVDLPGTNAGRVYIYAATPAGSAETNPGTTTPVSVRLPATDRANIRHYDALGRRVSQVTGPGVYFIFQDGVITRKAVLIR